MRRKILQDLYWNISFFDSYNSDPPVRQRGRERLRADQLVRLVVLRKALTCHRWYAGYWAPLPSRPFCFPLVRHPYSPSSPLRRSTERPNRQSKCKPKKGATSNLSSWQHRLASFEQALTALYHRVARALGPAQPAPTSDPVSPEPMDPRTERVSRGFFEDMKAFFTDRDSQNADPNYQEERLRGVSDRVDEQFHDVSRLLEEFEEKQRGEGDTSR